MYEYIYVLEQKLNFACIYIMVPDYENNTILYSCIRTTSGENEFVPVSDPDAEPIREGDSIPYEIDDELREILEFGGVVELNNAYGRSYACFTPIYADGTESSVIGVLGVEIAQVTLEKEQIRKFVITLISFLALMVLACLFIAGILNRKILRRAKEISQKMNEFADTGIAAIENGIPLEKIPVTGEDEFDLIARSFNMLTDSLESSMNEAEALMLQKAHAEKELSLAGEMQREMLPKGHFEFAGGEINAQMKPAAYVGGDFYFYTELKNGHVIAGIADVCGSGMSASILMSKTITAINALSHAGKGLSEILYDVNNMLVENNPKSHFVTVFILDYDPETRKLVYANAGHNAPYLVKNSGEFVKLEPLGDVACGWFEDTEYSMAAADLEPGDMVFMYTDGLNEAESLNDGQFGYDRLEAILAGSKEHNYIEEFTEAVAAFSEGTEQSDDLTMIMLTVK